MPHLELPDGARLHVEERPGSGAPILLAHAAFRSAASWWGVAKRLEAGGRRVLLPDDRGHGASQPWRSGQPWDPESVARDPEAVLEALAPDGAHLVGHSRGGNAVSWIAVHAPRLAHSLAVVCAPPEGSEAFRAHFRHQIAAAKSDRAREALTALSMLPDDAWPTHALRRYRGPALVVEAEDDPLYSPTHTLFWRAYLPYASFERVPGGHFFFEDEPAWLAARLLKHVEESERASTP